MRVGERCPVHRLAVKMGNDTRSRSNPERQDCYAYHTSETEESVANSQPIP
jgi:hypothetical protein